MAESEFVALATGTAFIGFYVILSALIVWGLVRDIHNEITKDNDDD